MRKEHNQSDFFSLIMQYVAAGDYSSLDNELHKTLIIDAKQNKEEQTFYLSSESIMEAALFSCLVEVIVKYYSPASKEKADKTERKSVGEYKRHSKIDLSLIAKIRFCVEILAAYGAVINGKKLKTQLSDIKAKIRDRFRSHNEILGKIEISTYIRKLGERQTMVINKIASIFDADKLAAYLDYCDKTPAIKASIESEEEEANKITKALGARHDYLRLLRLKKSLFSHYDNLISNKKSFYTDVRRFGGNPFGRMVELPFTVCHCGPYTWEKRKKLENLIFAELLMRHPCEKTSQINYLSLGSGGLLQDFLVAFRLIKTGYSKINIYLIEPKFEYHDLIFFKKIINLLAKEKGRRVEVIEYSSVFEVPSNCNIHFASAIDFDSLFKGTVFSDVVKTQKLLDKKGFFLFSHGPNRFIINHDDISHIEFSVSPSLTNVFSSASESKCFERKSVSIAMLRQERMLEKWVLFLPLLKNKNFLNISITMLSPNSEGYFGLDKTKKSRGFNQEALQYFLKICLGGKKNVSLNLVDDISDITNRASSSGYDVVLKIGQFLNGSDEISKMYLWEKKNQNWTSHSERYSFVLCESSLHNFRFPLLSGAHSTLLDEKIALNRADCFEQMASTMIRMDMEFRKALRAKEKTKEKLGCCAKLILLFCCCRKLCKNDKTLNQKEFSSILGAANNAAKLYISQRFDRNPGELNSKDLQRKMLNRYFTQKQGKLSLYEVSEIFKISLFGCNIAGKPSTVIAKITDEVSDPCL